jgi:hypothetical protein
MTGMFITYLLHVYAVWLFASAMFIWLGSVLYRTTRDTLNASYAEAEEIGTPAPQAIPLPARPVREPTVHLTAAA